MARGLADISGKPPCLIALNAFHNNLSTLLGTAAAFPRAAALKAVDFDTLQFFTHPLPASAPTAATYFRQIVDAIGFIHSRGYAHRDISLENVLLDGTTPKVCDFGLAIDITARVPQAVGKTFYMAPEMYTKKPYDPAAADSSSVHL
ncbi:hypothetical protein ACHHYP_14701 [Achlya hypogyna]|uniref:Protein kinase domain-containing protein n=1 Tax=Achlya hypogyna TaxID=1202772 RepID=A0A1V9ZF35_ACHHY|nr:hypothetical protein ACHHYP_14701 [Achlya hypogyna]